MILKLLLNTEIIWIKLMLILKNTTQIRNKILIDLDDMIADMVNNNKLNLIVT